VPSHSDDLQRAFEMLTLGEILRRQRPDLRFVPLESLIGLVVRNGSRPESVPPRLRRAFRTLQQETGRSQAELPAIALEQMLAMPSDSFDIVEPSRDFRTQVQAELRRGAITELRQEMRERTGFEFSVPRPVPQPPPKKGLPDTPLEVIFKNLKKTSGRALTLACVAAGPLLGRALFSPDPRIQAAAIAGAIACGITVTEAVR